MNSALVSDDLAALQDPLLTLLLEKAVNTSPDIEHLLLRVRRTLLACALQGDLPELLDAAGGEFLAAMAQQCFLNEFVWFETPEESDGVERLIGDLTRELRERREVAGDKLAVLACYRPLHELSCAAQIMRYYVPGARDYLYKVLRLQLIGPLHERGLRDQVHRLTPVVDDVSKAVREQYETHPYPRWLHLDHHEPASVGAYLAGVFGHAQFLPKRWPESPRVLVAGCGTGKQAISAAMRFAHCDVTALDLSLASLTYGQRMSRELNVTNVEFVHGDILALPDDLADFDVIECLGVLHHMRDPIDGWRRLVDKLRPNGLLRIGLYSERARRVLAPARELAASRGWRGDTSGIRAFRQHVLATPADDPLRDIMRAADFFSTSECRDLIFHVNEQDFTLERIARHLSEFALEFIGFELANEQVIDAYRQLNPTDPEARDLARWSRFEARYPDVFASMYQFWTVRR